MAGRGYFLPAILYKRGDHVMMYLIVGLIIICVYVFIAVLAYNFLNELWPYTLDDDIEILRAIFWPITLLVLLIWVISFFATRLSLTQALKAAGKKMRTLAEKE